MQQKFEEVGDNLQTGLKIIWQSLHSLQLVPDKFLNKNLATVLKKNHEFEAGRQVVPDLLWTTFIFARL